MPRRIRINLKSEKGNALLMALSIILILTSFGTVSLMTSVANIQMSAKHRDWSKDYFKLDMEAERKVNDLSAQLEIAEAQAQRYMAGHYYAKDQTDIDSDDELRIGVLDGQEYIYTQWQTTLDPNTSDAEKKKFMEDTLKRVYYYYASSLMQLNLHQTDGFTTSYLKNNTEPINDLNAYQRALFDDSYILNDLKLIEKIAVNDSSVIGKAVSVKLNVQLPAYEMVQQSKKITFNGNPVWTNVITATGSIGFEGSGDKRINGDLFSADKDEFPENQVIFFQDRDDTTLLNDNDTNVYPAGVYSDGANVDIYGNVYSRGNLHIIGSQSEINVHLYSDSSTSISTDLKNQVFANNNLFFDYRTMKDIAHTMITSSDDFIQNLMTADKPYIPLIYEDVYGGNVYCNSLSVDEKNYKGQYVDNSVISVDGNVTAFNDIKMNGTSSEITVGSSLGRGNLIGINSEAIKKDPNACSTVINNKPLSQDGSSGSTIKLNGKFIVPGTAYAEYAGYRAYEEYMENNDASYDTISSKRYYRTGESITARSSNIFSAYLTPVPSDILNDSTNPWHNAFLQYMYVSDQYTLDPQSGNSFYLLRGEEPPTLNKESDKFDAKRLRLVEHLGRDPVQTNIFSGLDPDKVEGYSLGEALLHGRIVHGPKITYPDPADPTNYRLDLSTDLQPHSILRYIDNQNAFGTFQESLYNSFIAKTWNLGTADKLATSFDGVFVEKSAIFTNTTLNTAINVIPSEKPTFVYLKPSFGSPAILDLSNSSELKGIIYCEGDLDIVGDGSLNGTIICEGNVKVEGSPTITYDEDVIQTVLVADGNARRFFAKLSMGDDTNVTTTSYDGAVRKNVVRYKIVEWKEIQQ
ncbi:DUF2572 family protein [Desulfosporosinus hippei]|uniref:Uncharacterized protein n=1 Tax=Desulfosporosinus hippei DSM 8344 TaxID=1121419 RepID=A0A1G8GCG0_9FIRM|nr:DUF2572 family protein [Desulfosporosinus hippei]SDH92112.1 Protein of unknown function [Desulfosporosinus hippei DSM 8344]